jgi:hypothetical protein
VKPKRSKIVKGKHTTFVYHAGGKLDMITDWDALALEINQAIDNWKNPKPVGLLPKIRRGR